MALLPPPTGAGGVNDAATTNAQQKLNLQYIAQVLRDMFGTGDSSTARQTLIDTCSDNAASVAAAATTSLATANVVTITNASGAVAITSFGTANAGVRRTVRVSITAGSVSITYNATSMILPGRGNITCRDGDTFDAVSLGAGNWRIDRYTSLSDIPSGSASAASGLSANTTLTANNANSSYLLSGAAAFTVTLPAASAVPPWSRFRFWGGMTGGVAATIARAGTDTFYIDGVTTAASIALYAADTIEIISNGSNIWHIVSGKIRYESPWTATLPGAAVAASFTHGLTVTPRLTYMIAECTTADGTYAVGDRINPLQANNAYATPAIIFSNATTIGIVGMAGATTTPWYAINKTTGVPVALTVASWKYKLCCEV